MEMDWITDDPGIFIQEGKNMLFSRFAFMQSFAQSFAPKEGRRAIDFHDHSVDVCMELLK